MGNNSARSMSRNAFEPLSSMYTSVMSTAASTSSATAEGGPNHHHLWGFAIRCGHRSDTVDRNVFHVRIRQFLNEHTGFFHVFDFNVLEVGFATTVDSFKVDSTTPTAVTALDDVGYLDVLEAAMPSTAATIPARTAPSMVTSWTTTSLPLTTSPQPSRSVTKPGTLLMLLICISIRLVTPPDVHTPAVCASMMVTLFIVRLVTPPDVQTLLVPPVRTDSLTVSVASPSPKYGVHPRNR